MQIKTFDVAVIGAGTAGMEACRQAADKGAHTCLIEAEAWGTTCILTGCIPSKLLLAAGDAARRIRRSGAFGLRTPQVEVDGLALMARVREEREHFLAGVLEKIEAIPEDRRLRGRARFLSPTRLQVGDDLQVEAHSIVIATGSRPIMPEPLEPVRERVLTTQSVFDLAAPPASLAVIGAGALGIELALAFGRLGVKVAVFDKASTVAGLKEPDVSRAAAERFAEELELHLETEVEVSADADGLRVAWRSAATGEAVFEQVLAATGRTPAVDGLDLVRAGLKLDDQGVPLHDPRTGRCGESRIFIAGDTNADRPVLHEVALQGRLAGANAATDADEQAPRRPAFSMTFSDPDCAAVGEPLAGLGDDAVWAVFDRGRGRARIDGRRPGFIKLWARRSDGRLLGGEMVGAEMESLAQLYAVLVQQELTAVQALELPFYHPTYAEELKGALEMLASARAQPQA
ncbi:MAG: dihydrolipoyl dehydrogenase [Caulobacteraceae bacterium]|nr:dihydrolipoyl dehydrogenase [Caulobacter sp.]